MQDDDFAAAFGGGPGPEDWLNGAAALAAALVREAHVLAQAAFALRGAVQPLPGDTPDVRRQRQANTAAADAALKAALLLDAADLIGPGGEAPAMADKLLALAKRAGAPSLLLAAPMRAAALSLTTDDGAARIAASALANDLAARLQGA